MASKLMELRDAGALFEAHSAEEIRGLERKVRADIEQKKEELRQMVGERYRDLIEAADTIGEMRKSAELVVGAVRDMEQYCGTLKKKPSPVGGHRAANTAQSHEKFYSTAAQIKLLLEIPEKIWSAMESSQYLRATQLYLLCCHLHSLLQLDSSASRYSPVLARFPILIRQVAAAGTFRLRHVTTKNWVYFTLGAVEYMESATILQESKSLLRCPSASDQNVAEALCSIMLLEDSSPRQALADFLLARKAGIQQLLNQPHHDSGVKSQVCALVELLSNTLYQAHALFYTPPEDAPPNPALNCGLLFSMLETITAQHRTGKGGVNVLREDMQSVGWYKHLPPSVVDFQPALRTLAHPINQDYLRETLQQWINMCNEDIKAGISALLVYVASLKGLAGIRDAVWNLLTSETMSQNWDKVCQRLLDRPIRFWENLLQQLFLDRLQTLIKEGLESISSESVQLLFSSLQELEENPNTVNKHIQYESNFCYFLWSESQSDLPTDAAWISVGNRGYHHRSGLSLKAQAVTPCIQGFCLALDSKLKIKLEDLFSYLPRETSATEQQNEAVTTGVKLSAFDRYGDASIVQEMLSQHCLSCMQHIQDAVSTQLQMDAQCELGDHSTILFSSKLCKVLFLARLCQSLSELCPHLRQCILGKSGILDQTIREPRPGKKSGKGKTADTQVPCKWKELKDKLIKQSLDAYGIWSSAVVKRLVHSFTQTLMLNTAGSVLATATQWDEIEIQEETEAGSSVTSKIRLPRQCSWYVQSLLFSLCQAVNRVGHALPKVTLHELLKTCLEEVISAYEKLCEETVEKKQPNSLTQTRALQLLFDLRYICLVLSSRTEDGKNSKHKPESRIQKVVDQLERCIDPFDLDVFTPHLNVNLNRLAQRTSVLFGLLTGAENQFTSRSSTLGIQEMHNVLPLASSQIRFGLLPLSMSSTRKGKSMERTAEDVNMQVPLTIQQPEDDTFRPGSLFRQLATQEDETQAPSLFKLGWLSSMTK